MTDNPLADRVAALEALVASMAAQIEELTITGPTPHPNPTPTRMRRRTVRGGGSTARSSGWNSVYTVLAAGHRLPWCARWWEHADVYERSPGCGSPGKPPGPARPGDDAAMAVWLRDQFDHHRAVLQGRDGPFADCHTGHRGTAAWLDITDPTPNRDEFTLDDAARLFFNRATPPGPMTVTDQAEADYQAAAAQFFATDPKERP